MMRPAIHLILHLLVPGLVAWFGFRKQWKSAWLIMTLTMAVDLDHLFAETLYDPCRCSIGFHPLHAPAWMGVYLLLAIFAKTRLIGMGLLIHMVLDLADCFWMRI